MGAKKKLQEVGTSSPVPNNSSSPIKEKKIKLTPEEKAREKAIKAAQKARNVEYKKIAKQLKMKDMEKRIAAMDIIFQDQQFFIDGKCLVPFMDSLVVKKKSIDIFMHALPIFKDFLFNISVPIGKNDNNNDNNNNIVSPVGDLEGEDAGISSSSSIPKPIDSHVMSFVKESTSRGPKFKGPEYITNLLNQQGGLVDMEKALMALECFKLTIDTINTISDDDKNNEEKATFIKCFANTPNAAINLMKFYQSLCPVLSNEEEVNTPEGEIKVNAMKMILQCLTFISDHSTSAILPILDDFKLTYLETIIFNLGESNKLTTDISSFLNSISKIDSGLQCMIHYDVISKITKCTSEWSGAALAEQRAQSRESLRSEPTAEVVTEEDQSASSAKSKKGDKKKKPDKKEKKAPPPKKEAKGNSGALPTDVLKNIAYLNDVVSRCIWGETKNVVQLKEEDIHDVIFVANHILNLNMPPESKIIVAKSLAQAIGVVGSSNESRRISVNISGSMPLLLALYNTPVDESSPLAGQETRRMAEKSLFHLSKVIRDDQLIENKADPNILGEEDTGTYLPAADFINTLNTDDVNTREMALRLGALFVSNESNTMALGKNCIAPLLKCLTWYNNNFGEEKVRSKDVGDISNILNENTLISLCQMLNAIAGISSETCNGIGTPANVELLANLFKRGPLNFEDYTKGCDKKIKRKGTIAIREHFSCYGPNNYDTAFTVVSPDQWDWDLNNIKDNDSSTMIVARSKIANVLATVADGYLKHMITNKDGESESVCTEEASAVVNFGIELCTKLLDIDIDIDNTRRAWEVFTPNEQCLLHHDLKISLLELLRAISTVKGGRDTILKSSSTWRPTYATPLPSLPSVGNTEEETEETRTQTSGSSSQASWSAPRYFRSWYFDAYENGKDDEFSYQYVKSLVGVLNPLFDAESSQDLTSSAIKTLYNLCWDKGIPEGAQPASVDNLAGAIVSMGASVPMITFKNQNKELSSIGSIIDEFMEYLVQKAVTRKGHWAQLPAISDDDDKKSKKGSKKDEGSEEEVPLGRPDPNRGPALNQWKNLLNANAKCTRTQKDQCSAMMAAIIGHNEKLVKSIMSVGGSPNCVDEKGMSPIMYALVHGNEESVTNLIREGGDVDAMDFGGRNILKYAFVSPHPDIIKETVARLDESKDEIEIVGGYPKPEMIPGNSRNVPFLLLNGADPNVSDDDGNYPLHWCLSGTYINTTVKGHELTLNDELHGDIHLRESKDTNADSIFDLLIEYGADVNLVNCAGQTPISQACRGGYKDEVLKLLELDADPNIYDSSGFLPLHNACMVAKDGYDEILKSLLTYGNERESKEGVHRDKRRRRTQSEKIVNQIEDVLTDAFNDALCPSIIRQKLLRDGQLLRMATKAGYYPIHYICGAGDNELGDIKNDFGDVETRVKMLKIIGGYTEIYADMKGLNDNMTALHMAAKYVEYPELIETLLDYGAYINSVDNAGMTPLLYALQSGNFKNAEYLLKQGAKAFTKNSQSNPLVIATQMGANAALIDTIVHVMVSEDISGKSLNPVKIDDNEDIRTEKVGELDEVLKAEDYASPLCIAACRGDLDVIKVLSLEPLINLTVQDGYMHETVLHVACKEGHLKIVEYLTTLSGIDYTIRDKRGHTPLFLALPGNNYEIVKLLMEVPAIQDSIIEELTGVADNPWSKYWPSTLRTAEVINTELHTKNVYENDSLHLECIATNNIVKCILEKVADRLPAGMHIHECYENGYCYNEWAAKLVSDAEEAELARRKKLEEEDEDDYEEASVE